MHGPRAVDVEVRDFTSAARAVLRELRARVDLDVWVVARRDGEDLVVLAALGDEGLARDGDVLPWSETYCSLVVAGVAPRAAPDLGLLPPSAGIRALQDDDLGACLSVPITAPDGALLGTLCGAARTTTSSGLDAVLPLVELQAGMLGTLLSHELRLEQERRRAEHAELEAFTDPLTGVGNRRAWEAALVAEEARGRRYASPAAVLVADLDALKEVNDTRGHDAGDRLLQALAALLAARVRESDLLVRLGGDEFGVLLPETDLAGATALAADVREALRAAGIACSLGVAARRAGGSMAQAWQDADAAMYVEKVASRSRHRVRPAPAAGASPGTAAPVPPVPTPRLGTVEGLLDLARTQLGMDVAFLSQFEGDEQVIREVAAGVELPAGPGMRQPREQTICQRIVDGRLPEAIPSTAEVPAVLALPATRAFRIGSYLAVPVRRSTGELFGTLCCFSHEPDVGLRPRDAGVLRMLSGLVMDLVEQQESAQGERRAVLERLDRMYDAGGPVPVYQPVLALDGLVPVGVEALSRFPDGSSPALWFAAASSVGAGADLELCALDRAVTALPDVTGLLSLNLSSATLVAPGCARRLLDLPLHRVVVEITEHEAVEDYQAVREVLGPLRARGLRLAVDDAGAGFASMRHVLALHPDYIKLDLSLVRGVDGDPARQALTAALVAFAASTGAQVVAEGIETAAELACLRRLGVELGQGYHLARPAPLAPAASLAG